MSGDEQPQDEELAVVRRELQETRDTLLLLVQKIRESEQATNEKIENLRNALHSANETINKYNRNLQFIEKKFEGMRTDTSTGIVLAILIFTLLFILSLFLR